MFLNKAFIVFFLVIPAQSMAAPCDQTYPAYAGNVVNCDGVLIPEAWAVSALQCVSADLPACRGGHRLISDLNEGCNKSLLELSKTCQTAFRKYENLALEAAGIIRPWYESPYLWFAFGVASSVTAVLLFTE